MPPEIPSSGLQLLSTIRSDGNLELSLGEVPVPEPGEGEVLLRGLARRGPLRREAAAASHAHPEA